MDIQVETVKQRESKLFALFCIISALLASFFTVVTVWATVFLAAAGIALFVLDLWYNGKISGVALFGLVLSSLALIFAVVIIIFKLADESILVDFELWLEKSLGFTFKDPLF